MTQRLVLRPGVEPGQAAGCLRNLAQSAANLPGSSGHEWFQLRDAYVRWTDDTEERLAAITSDGAVLAALHSDRHWHIREAASKLIMPLPLIRAELTRQKERLEAMASDLDERRDRLADAPGTIAVVDTNVLLHYLPSASSGATALVLRAAGLRGARNRVPRSAADRFTVSASNEGTRCFGQVRRTSRAITRKH